MSSMRSASSNTAYPTPPKWMSYRFQPIAKNYIIHLLLLRLIPAHQNLLSDGLQPTSDGFQQSQLYVLVLQKVIESPRSCHQNWRASAHCGQLLLFRLATIDTCTGTARS